MSSLKPHRRTATRTHANATTAAMAIVIELIPVTAATAPVSPLAELDNRPDSVSSLPANVAAPEGIELPDDGSEVPNSTPLPSSSGENTDPNMPKLTSHRPDQIARSHPSDAATDNWLYFYVVYPSMELGRGHLGAMDQNLGTVVRISSAAKNDPQAQGLALDDDYPDPLANISTAFDANLGQRFHDAFDEGRPPKVKALLSGNLVRGGSLASSTFFERYAYGYGRPFMVVPERIERYYCEGQDDPYSTTPSYPSDHTNKAAWTSTMLVMVLPEVTPQIQVRASEAGHSRFAMGVHYPPDVMDGRMMGNQAVASHWADPESRLLTEEAMDELWMEFECRCGDTIANYVVKDTSYMNTAAAVQ